jgi:ElaB/YqjD/DUF883 family membrane-anchored ribosome-binding protein
MTQQSNSPFKPSVDSVNMNKVATDLLDEGKKYAHDLYEDGLKKVDEVQHNVQAHSEELLNHVRAHPLKAILIAGGVGMLLSALLRK